MNILIFILIAYGISNIIVYGALFEGIRNYLVRNDPNFTGKLATCMMCNSFWVGVILTSILFSPVSTLFCVASPLTYFFNGCLTSGCVWLIHTLQEFFEK